MKKYEYILPLLLILMPPFVMASLIYRYGIDIPFWDHWELVPLLHKLHFGELTFYDLWKQEGNEHRILFPKIIMLALAHISNWNIWFELYANLVFGGIILFFLYLLLSQTFNTHNKKLILYLTAVSSFLVFSPVQWLSYLHAWKFQMFLAALSPIVAVWSLTRYPNSLKGITIAILSAIIGSYSFIAGILVWFSAIILLLHQKNWKYILLWFFFTLITIALYFLEFKILPERNIFKFINYPLDFIIYIFTYIGALLGFENQKISFIIGISLMTILLIAIIIIWRHYVRSLNKIFPWVSLVIYVILCAIITAFGRLEKGEVFQATSSHYTTISTLFAISTLVIVVFCIVNYLKENKQLPAKLVITLFSICTLLILSYTLTFSYIIEGIGYRKETMNLAKYCLFNPSKCDVWKILHPDTKIILERIKMLEQIPYKGGIKKIIA